MFDATVAQDGGELKLSGSAAEALARNVHHLDPETAIFAAMLEGWAVQQHTRFLKVSTVTARLDLVRRFAEFSNQYPWQWQPTEAEAFFESLRLGERPLAVSTGRSYQNSLRMFLNYILDSRYGWVPECLDRFGVAPVQILHEWTRSAMSVSTRATPDAGP